MVYSTSNSIKDHIGQAPEEAVKSVLASLKQSSDDANNLSTDGHNADYGAVYKDGSIDIWGYPCHKKFEFIDGQKGPVYTFSKAKRFRGDPGDEFHDAAQAYFLWITGPESPWKEALDYPIPEEFRSQEFMYDHGYVFDCTIVPSNVHHQFMIASRMQKEWPYLISAWHTLVTVYGYTREWAFFYLTMFYAHPKGGYEEGSSGRWKFKDFFSWEEYSFAVETYYDFPLDVINCDEGYALNFLGRKMLDTGRNKPLSESQRYTPVNSLWGKNGMSSYSSETFVREFKDRYKEELQIKEESKIDSWGNPKTTSVMKITIDVLVSIGLKEQERLYGLL